MQKLSVLIAVVSIMLASLAPAAAQVAAYDLIIFNARIVDGSGSRSYAGSIAIKDGKIARVGQFKSGTARRTIDAGSQVVAPGFIDVHAHTEEIFASPQAQNFVRMGVTSLVTGNCGGSALDIGEFLGRYKTGSLAVNLATLIGHNTVRRKEMGLVNQAPTAAQQASMNALVERAMRDGAVGLSTGLEYLPGMYANTGEIVELAKVARKFGGLYATHMRHEGIDVKKSVAESLAIGEGAGIPVEISHFKIADKSVWGMSDETIAMVKAARKRGMKVTVDQYAYTASSTSLDIRLPNWAVEGGREEGRKRLADPASRQKIIAEMKSGLRVKGFDDFSFAYVAVYGADAAYNGKNISEITQLARGRNDVDSQIDQILEMYSNGGAQMVYRSMNEEDVRKIMREPFTMIAADSGVREFGVGTPHPRGYGNNARVLARYVREQKIITLEDAIRKMTSLPARTFGLKGRGLLKAGFAADIVIFDPATVTDKATFENPHQYAEGFSSVIVNGKVVFANGKMTGELPGQPIYGPARH